MKVAVPVFRSRISPVFDVAHLCLLVEYHNGEETGRHEALLTGRLPRERIAVLSREGVDVLICGAITAMTQYLAETAGIRVRAGVAGEVETILHAFREKNLDRPCFRMPGCRRRWRGRGPGFGGRDGPPSQKS